MQCTPLCSDSDASRGRSHGMGIVSQLLSTNVSLETLNAGQRHGSSRLAKKGTRVFFIGSYF